MIVEFLDMKPELRRDEAQFWREFEEVRPRVLGALLDAAAAGLRNLPSVKLDQPPANGRLRYLDKARARKTLDGNRERP